MVSFGEFWWVCAGVKMFKAISKRNIRICMGMNGRLHSRNRTSSMEEEKGPWELNEVGLKDDLRCARQLQVSGQFLKIMQIV